MTTISENARAAGRGRSSPKSRAGVPPLPLGAAVVFLLLAGPVLAPSSAHAYELRPQPAHVANIEGIDRQFVLAAGEPIPDAAVPALDPEVAAIADAMKGLISAGRAGKWLLLVMFALKLVIFGLRLLAKRLPPSKLTAALTSRWGGWALNLAGSQVGAFAAAAATGTLTGDTALALIFAGVTTSLAAAGTRELVNDLKPAQAAGLAAAANPGPTLGA